MLPMSINNPQPGSVRLAGASAAFLVGSLAVIIGGATDQLRALLTAPVIVVLGLVVASVLGAGLARKASTSRLIVAAGIAIAYGLLVPVLVGVLIALPLAPFAAAVAVIAWPVTVPSALAWFALIRLDRSRERLATIPVAPAALILATVLLVLRFTQPGTTSSAETGKCVSFPGERIATIAWSPDGAWLGVGSERNGQGIVRVLEQAPGRIIELARGPYVDAASSGVAVGPGGSTTYLVDIQGPSANAEEEGATLWVASPNQVSRPFAELPTPGLSDLIWTPDGIAAVQWADPLTWTETHRLVWVRPSTSAASAFEPIAPDLILDYPALAPFVNPTAMSQMTIKTPSGERIVDWPSDASGEVSVTTDGGFLVFHARALTDDQVDEKYSELVAQATEGGGRVVLVPGEGWTPKIAGGRVAYLTFPAYFDNSVCIKEVAIK